MPELIEKLQILGISMAYGSNTFNLRTERKCSSKVTVVLMITYVIIFIKYFVVISATSLRKWWHRKNIRVLISDLLQKYALLWISLLIRSI